MVESTNGHLAVTLHMGAGRLIGPDVDMVTRLYNGAAPWKTFAIYPGDRLSVTLQNDLEGPLSGPDPLNGFHHPNTTNLHVHGLHVSPNAPSDDVLYTAAQPRGSAQYEYHLIPDHSPGTYWYHPHHHGSVLLQAGAGAAGAIVVRDPAGYLSPQLEALSEHVLVVQDMPASKLKLAAETAKDELFHVNRWTTGDELLLVNGAPQPVISARPGEWQRWRIVMAGLSTYLNLGFGACEAALLAKDGIYINDFPRFVPRVSIPPGGRSDLVIRCQAGEEGKAVDYTVESFPRPTDVGVKTFTGKVLTVRVEGEAKRGPASERLQAWQPASRPAYLQDTRSQQALCTCGTSMGLGGNEDWVQGHLWGGPKSYMHRSPKDAVVERELTGINKHPYHQHSWAFQLQETPAGDDPYFKAGDWHDTYMNVHDSAARIRFSTVDYTGPMVLHCHDLSHSDKGMIAVEHVGGDECGCDLLSQSEMVSHAAMQATAVQTTETDPLVVASGVALIAMLLLMAGGAVTVSRSWHQDDACYSAMENRL